jgi:hypothetical protein
MLRFVRRFVSDVRERRYLDAYGVGFVVLVVAVLSVVGDNLPDDVKWAAVLAGVGILVIRVTMPESRPHPRRDLVLGDRSAFDDSPLSERLKRAKRVWIFAPSAANVLSEQHVQIIRKHVLARESGHLRVVVLDPTVTPAVELAVRQLDESLEFPRRNFRNDLTLVVEELCQMSRWDIRGKFSYRFLDYNPGFSIIALESDVSDDLVVVEFHGFHNESTASRMHVEFTGEDNPRWYSYWTRQFEHIWENARAPGSPPDDRRTTQAPPQTA